MSQRVHVDPLAWKESWDELMVQRPVVVRMHISGRGDQDHCGAGPLLQLRIAAGVRPFPRGMPDSAVAEKGLNPSFNRQGHRPREGK